MIALVPVRAGELPVGATEAAREAGGAVAVVGDGSLAAAEGLAAELGATASRVLHGELGPFAPGRFARLLAGALEKQDVIVLPAAPDGRDLAPRLAAELGRPLVAGATRLSEHEVDVVRRGGAQLVTVRVDGPYVATLVSGVREPLARPVQALTGAEVTVESLELSGLGPESGHRDAEVIELLGPDPSLVDLAEAARILAGGAGLGGPEVFALLGEVAAALGASVGATRVVTDAGILGHERQIGTTGASVRPRLYVAFGISGAAQHVGGLGEPEHVVAVNTDESCPMMAMADLAVVADAAATLRALAVLVSSPEGTRGRGGARSSEAAPSLAPHKGASGG